MVINLVLLGLYGKVFAWGFRLGKYFPVQTEQNEVNKPFIIWLLKHIFWFSYICLSAIKVFLSYVLFASFLRLDLVSSPNIVYGKACLTIALELLFR